MLKSKILRWTDRCRRHDGARSEKESNKRNDLLIGSFTVTCTPTTVHRRRSICIGHLTGVHNTSAAPIGTRGSPPPVAHFGFLASTDGSVHLCFSIPACFSPSVPLAHPGFSAPSRLSLLRPPLFVSVSGERAPSLRPSQEPPSLERAFPPCRGVEGWRRQGENGVGEPRMRVEHGGGQRAG